MTKTLSSFRRTASQEKKSSETINRYLCFLLNDKTYAVNILKVKEIIEHSDFTPIPMMPDFVWGAINLRGEVVPIIDISLRLNMPATHIQKRTCFVIVEVLVNETRLDVGIVVDGVSRVTDISSEQHAVPPSFGGTIKNEYIQGLGKANDEFILLLNIDKILSMDDIMAFKQASAVAEDYHLATSDNL